ncbi:MAG: glycosyltransferase family 4 protein [Pseudoalteromonas nigrifaciens]|uniref:glycosyltransferase family 4 protein n=1 Tax=Pseudoalteromonas nigrifaciens TaxID=28109 RepID=UPI003F9CB32B
MSNRNKIFIVTEYIGLNHNSTAYYWAKIALYLNKYYELIVICPKNSHTESFFHEHQLSVYYVKDLGFDKNKLVSRVLGQLKYAWSFNRHILKFISKDDIVFTGTNPIISLFFTALVKKVKTFKWIMICHDIFPDNLIPSGVMRFGAKYKFVNTVFSLFYRTPDIITPIGRDMAIKLQQKGVIQEKIVVVPNWADHNKITMTAKRENQIIQNLNWQENLIFCFFGNIGRLQGISNLLSAIALVKSESSRFLFIGSGAEEQLVKNFVASVGKNNSHYYGELQLKDNNIGLNCGDIALVTLEEGMYGLGVPSKAYFSMAADKPILLVGDKGSELELLINEHNVGWFCESGNPEVLAESIDRISESWLTANSRIYPRKLMIDHFSEEQSLKQYKSLVDKLFEK